jgi:hypothetical protein
MSEIVQFPGAVAPADHTITNGDDRRHAEAFRDLESRVCDLDRWAELAGRLIGECACDRRSWRELELAALVVERLSGLAGAFRENLLLPLEKRASGGLLMKLRRRSVRKRNR